MHHTTAQTCTQPRHSLPPTSHIPALAGKQLGDPCCRPSVPAPRLNRPACLRPQPTASQLKALSLPTINPTLGSPGAPTRPRAHNTRAMPSYLLRAVQCPCAVPCLLASHPTLSLLRPPVCASLLPTHWCTCPAAGLAAKRQTGAAIRASQPLLAVPLPACPRGIQGASDAPPNAPFSKTVRHSDASSAPRKFLGPQLSPALALLRANTPPPHLASLLLDSFRAALFPIPIRAAAGLPLLPLPAHQLPDSTPPPFICCPARPCRPTALLVTRR